MAVAAVLCTAGTGLVLVGSAAAADAGIRASQPLVVVLRDHVARVRPERHAAALETVAARRPLTRVRTVLPELDRVTSLGGPTWIRVQLPGRPNGHTGWIRDSGTRPGRTPWRIAIERSERRVVVYRDGRVARRFAAVVGTRSTPTPAGRFFVEEAVALAPTDAGGPFALATSARSPVLQEFNGGPGQIAIHGIDHLPDPLGTAASHGCIRLGTSAITWLAARIGAGVPVTVSR